MRRKRSGWSPKYADACNIFERTLPGIKGNLDVLQDHCERLGRDYAEIEKTTLGRGRVTRHGADGSQSLEQAIDRFGELASLGIDEALVGFPNRYAPDAFEVMADFVQAVGKITPAGR